MKGSEEKRDKKKIVYFSAKEGVSIRYLRRTPNLFDMSLTRDHQYAVDQIKTSESSLMMTLYHDDLTKFFRKSICPRCERPNCSAHKPGIQATTMVIN